MTDKFNEDLIAELLAINMAVHRTLTELARQSKDPKGFLSQQLEIGLAGMSKTNLWSIPEDRRSVVVENACGRYTEIISSIKP